MTKVQIALRKARRELNLSCCDVQNQSSGEITSAYVSMIERSPTMIPSAKILKTLARVYHLNFIDLMILAGYMSAADLKERGMAR